VVVPADAQPAPSPSSEELAGLVAVLAGRVDGLEAENTGLRAENAELRRRLGMNSGNSPGPPSKEPIAAKAERKAKRSADRSSRERSKDRKPGGQQGHQGSGLTPAAVPDRAEAAEVPAQCLGCGADLADPATGASDASAAWAQVRDILPTVLENAHWWLPRRRCGSCQKITTAAAPHAQAGSVVYGPGINAAAVLLSSEGNVPVERTAALMEALLGTPVSSGFIARALARLAQRLQAAGFDAAMKAALQAEDVLCGDETPANVITKDTDEHGETVPGAPDAETLRTPDARLIWYAAMGSRSGPAIAGLGVLDGWHGYLARDDYAAWHQSDAQPAGVQQCAAHLIRHCKGVLVKGHPGAGLQLAARPDETQVIEPGCCGRCGADLAGAAGRIASRVQVFDIPTAALTVTEYQMMSSSTRQPLARAGRRTNSLPWLPMASVSNGSRRYSSGEAGQARCAMASKWPSITGAA